MPPPDFNPLAAPTNVAETPPPPPEVIVPPNRYPMPAPAPDTVASNDLVTTPLPDSMRYARAAAAQQFANVPVQSGPAAFEPTPAQSGPAATQNLADLDVDKAAEGVAAVGKRRPKGGGAPAAPDLERQAITKAGEAAESEAKAAEDEGEAAAAASNAKAEALQKRADQQNERIRQREIFEQAQNEGRARAASIAEQAEAEVANHEFHDHFSERPVGAKILTAIGGFFAGAGGGAQGVEVYNRRIQNVIENDFARQRADLDKKMTLARAKREGVRDFEGWVRDQRAALDHKEALAQNAAADEVDAAALAGGAKVDQAKAKALGAKLRADAANKQVAAEHGIIESETQRAHAKLLKAEAAKNYAEADKARAAAGTEPGGEGISPKEEAMMLAQTKQDRDRMLGTAKSPGVVQRISEARALGTELQDAFASGDPSRINSALVSAKEKVTRLNTGGVPTSKTIQMIDELVGAPQEAQEKIRRLLGNPQAATQRFGAVKSMVDQLDDNLVSQAKDAHERTQLRYEGPNGIARTPGRKRVAEGALDDIFGGITDRRGNHIRGGQAAAPAAAARTYSPTDDQALAWANANPNDPRAARIHQLQGR